MALGKLDFPKFTKEFVLGGTSAATSANYGVFFVADRPCVVEAFDVRYETAGTAGITVQLRKVASGTSISSAGTASDILAAAVSVAATATTVYSGTPTKNQELSVGQGLAIVPSATPTSLASFVGRIKLKYLRPA
jgi:hypothetical protein